MKKILILLTVVIFLLSVESSVFARDVDDFWELGFRLKQSISLRGNTKVNIQREDIDNRLNLTHKQRHNIRQLRQKARSKLSNILSKKRVLYEEIMLIQKEEGVNEDVRAKKVELQKLNKYSYRIFEKYNRKIEYLLNPEQKAELAKIKQEMRQEED